MSVPQGRRGRHTYRNPKMRRQRWHFPREEGEEGTGYEVVNEPLPLHYSHHYYHHHPTTTIHEAMETQSAASSSSSSLPSPSSSSSVPTRSSRRNHRSAAAAAAAAAGRRILPAGAPTPSSSSSSLASPALDYFASASASVSASASFSSSPSLSSPSLSSPSSSSPSSSSPSSSSPSSSSPSSSSPPFVQIADIPNTNMATLALTRRSHQQPSYSGRRRLVAGTTPQPRVSAPPKESPHPRQASQQQLQQQPQQQPSSQLLPGWRHWESVAIYLDNVPLEANTYTLWRAFKDQGNIFSIDLYEDVHGNREAKGKIRFKPAPNTDFWRENTYTIKLRDSQLISIFVKLDQKHQVCRIQSPVQSNISFPAEVKIPVSSLDIGILVNETTMLPMRTVGAGAHEQTFLVFDLKHRVLFVYFQLPIFNPKNKPTTVAEAYQEYRLKIPFRQMTQVFQTHDSASGRTSHFTFLDSPPLYYRRIKNIHSTFIDESSWRDSDTWFRQTHIVHNPQAQATLPVSLRKLNPVIDIGRWNAFKVSYPKAANDKGSLSLACTILRDYNVAIENTDRFTQCENTKQMTTAWKWIDLSESRSSKQTLSSLFDLIDESYINLPFSVRYQLEVCLSNGYLSEFTMPREFVVKLFELGEKNARKLLEHVAEIKKIYHDPMKIFDLKFVKGVTDARIPSYCCYMRSARVTPSTVYYSTPTVDISNRVIRYFIEYADRFLRVRFTDEKLIGRINSTADNTMDEVFTRIKRTLANGIVIGDRHYEFLAFGNSQFREHGAYFFAPLPNLTAANIRAWMGHFNNRNVAKYAARLGQCFSSTRAVAGCPVQVRKIDDVVRNGYTFSDGVGRISKFLAQMATSELKIKTLTGDIPSAFQFRLGGSKGMLTVSPHAQRQEVHIRDSQDKFAAGHNGLEIIRWSQFSLATLNRQLILVLSTLGIPDGVFHNKLRTMLRNLDEAMTNDSQAIYLLKKYVDPNQMTLVVSQMVFDGFRKSQDPFMTSIMRLWRAWHLKYLKEKAKIVVDQGASLLGCMDETGALKGYFQDSIPSKNALFEEKLAALPEIFVQVSRPDNDGKYEIIEGVCILARNPSLHPGDIRVVKAVNVPELSHLQDVVVLPQTGDRDISSMCSGGDLDGDDYLVIWDKDLIPNDWFREPMDYASNKARDLDHDVTVDEITSFFVTYMKNDCLPRIAHAHLAWADRLEDGVNEEKCVRLAQLHSDAVDYNKTGNPPNMTRTLQPRKWPHFMEKRHKSKEQIYHSNKVLGQLYDVVERVDFVPSLEMPFDKRILECNLEVAEDLMQFARDLKGEYDSAMRRIMAQHEIKTEFEVWSTFVLNHANMSKDYKFHEELGAISSSLREGFRKQCFEKADGRSFQDLAPLAVAMYRVTQQEMAAALKKHRDENPADEKLFHRQAPKMDQLPLISFPWLLPHILGKIALGHYEEPERPADSVEKSKASEKEANPNPQNHHAVDAVPGPGNVSTISEDTKETTQVIPEDPFGLFAGDTHILDHSSFTNKNSTLGVKESVESLEQLIDFGFSDALKSPSSTITSSSILHTGMDSNLLEFGENPKPEPATSAATEAAEAAEAPTTTTTANMAATMTMTTGTTTTAISKQQSEQTDTPEIVGAEGTGAESVEIVEEEDELQPDAVDKLNEILGF